MTYVCTTEKVTDCVNKSPQACTVASSLLPITPNPPVSDCATSILVVDDEPVMRLLLRTAIQKEGYRVIEASNGEECLALFQSQQPDIILMDAMMPKMDGFECCSALQKLCSQKHSPVLMITSLDDSESIDKAFASGAADYATKPIHWALLRQRIRRLQDSIKRDQAEKQIEASLKEKKAMLKEIHHRVKNNLQIISSLLNLQSKSIKDKHILDLFRESQNRVRLMALIHEKLYQSSDLSRINFNKYVEVLLSYLIRSYEVDIANISLVLEVEEIFLEIDTAVSCGLIINELVSNSLKYAFSKRSDSKQKSDIEDAPTISITAKRTGPETFSIIYRDNGIGLPADFDIDSDKTLGQQIISSLTMQLDGELEATSRSDGSSGAEFSLTRLSLKRESRRFEG
ncbi:MAG: histidine kinase dimerization/phosphoacceptor domain -containing protein [Cyanobacteria bacterium J06621_3]